MSPPRALLIAAPGTAAADRTKLAAILARTVGEGAVEMVENPGMRLPAAGDLRGEPDIAILFGGRPETLSFETRPPEGLVVRTGSAEPGNRSLYDAAERAAWSLPDRARLLLDRLLEEWAGPPQGTVLIHDSLGAVTDTVREMWLEVLRQRFHYLGTPRLVQLSETITLLDSVEPPVTVVGMMSAEYGAPQDLVQRVGPGRFYLVKTRQHGLSTLALRDGDSTGKKQIIQRTVVPDRQIFERTALGRAISERPGGAMTPIGRFRAYSSVIGPLDGFGHRIGGLLKDYAKRPDGHLLVALSGGSAVFGPRCFHDQTLAVRLQEALSRRLPAERRVTVLNFGQPGAGLIDVILRYVTLGRLCRPDIVIEVSGRNDLIISSFAEEAMLRDYDLVLELENAWASAPTNDLPLGERTRAILDRLEQYRRVAEADGCRFLFALQPWYASKTLSAAEKSEIAEHFATYPANRERCQHAHREWGPFRAALAAHFEAAATPGAAPVWRDLNAAPRLSDDTFDMFHDDVHLTPAGHETVGAELADFVWPHLQDLMREKRA